MELGSIPEVLTEIAENPKLNSYVQNYISEHNFHEELLADDVSLVEIDTPNRARTDQFIFIDDDDYLRIITAERRKWTKKTVEKLIKYLPQLERVFLTPGDLEEIVEDLYGTSITGFTAKYHSYKTSKRASIRFHGGDDEDLEKVERFFDAKPTRLEFGQRNSPSNAVHSSVAQEGHYTFSRVRPGSEDRGVQTLNELSEAFEIHDQRNYDVENRPTRQQTDSGAKIEGSTTIHLRDPDGDDFTGETADKLEEDILSKQKYEYSTWERGDYMVFDKDHGEQFEVTVEDSDISVHAKESTSSSSLRDFSSLVYENFDSTFTLEKDSRELIA
ncbi:hypothetical protein [Halobaculum lipolyticum]|uniref:hypothetical protein n=1 Tax=Halobaculum lipolyticum TaxID=3032001 RepID=UPI0024C3D21A|nr:hypothetical protein [Halobaculum sp. DT31]